MEPPNWWVGMPDSKLEIMLYDKGISALVPTVNGLGVTIDTVVRLQNPNYLFITVSIPPTSPAGSFDILLQDEQGRQVKSFPYTLSERSASSQKGGVDASDLIYLIMPDRFANGDKGNDQVPGMAQQHLDRDMVFYRHGGDLVGVMEHLDYLEELGITALWLNPVLENNQPYESYHGYAVTDHYRIDPRLGTNEQYKMLVRLAHEHGIKVIMDVIFNHVGDHHWFIQDLPDENWIHQWKDGYKEISYRAPVHFDPHAATADFKQVTESWFDKHMPDLNQQHPQLANYLIQNAIWWTAYTGQDGFRIDTYAYCDQAFMSRWNQAMREAFPDLSIFAETYVHGTGVQSWFAEGEREHGHNSHLPGVTDFQMYYALTEALTAQQGWTSGVAKLYYTLSQDYLYKDPYRNVLFLDNHDLGRIYGLLGEDVEKMKSAISLLLTLRGIPMLYYGTELLMTGSGGAFGEGGRKDFPGGFSGDKPNKFKEKGRTSKEQQLFTHLQRLAQYRKTHTVLQTGQLTQFIPKDGVYVFFRHDAEHTVMVVYNSNDKAINLDTARFQERTAGYTGATDITSGERMQDINSISIPAGGCRVLELW
ncbi:MAG: glycoside hydrolase family 13 protein [Saprospiraceae bacterium]